MQKTELALAFLDVCNAKTGLNIIVDEFHKTITGFGFSAVACGGWGGVGKQRKNRFFFNSWPQAWLDIYNAGQFFTDDPFVQESFRRLTLYAWTELDWDHRLSPRGREIERAAYDYGWREAIGVPVHGPAGYQGLISIAGMQEVKLSQRDKALLAAVSVAVHERCRAETGFGIEELSVPLTPREIECLQWAAIGKTDWEIGQVLGISASTAHYHVERAKKKLGATSRVQAVAVAVLRGML